MANDSQTTNEVVENKTITPNIDISDEEFESYIESLDELSLLEASNYKKTIDESINQWNMCKEALAQLGADNINEKINKSVMEANLLESVNVDTMENFNEDYEKTISRLNAISDKLLQIIDRNKDKIESTTFMTNEMLTILNKRQATFSGEEAKLYAVIKETFEDRLHGGYRNREILFNKFKSYVYSHKKEIRRSFLSCCKNSSVKPEAIKVLLTQFSDNRLKVAAMTLYKNFNIIPTGNIDVDELKSSIIHLIFVFLAYLFERGKKDRSDAYAKILILDILDIACGIYDIECMTPREYFEDMIEMFNFAGDYIVTAKLRFPMAFDTYINLFGKSSKKIKENPKNNKLSILANKALESVEDQISDSEKEEIENELYEKTIKKIEDSRKDVPINIGEIHTPDDIFSEEKMQIIPNKRKD